MSGKGSRVMPRPIRSRSSTTWPSSPHRHHPCTDLAGPAGYLPHPPGVRQWPLSPARRAGRAGRARWPGLRTFCGWYALQRAQASVEWPTVRRTSAPYAVTGCERVSLWSAGMDGGADRPAGVRGNGAAQEFPPGMGPLVGRGDALRAFGEALDASGSGSCCFLGLVGEPGAGKTRLLGELAAEAARRGVVILAGRAAEFEQEMPFGVVVDALDDQVESGLPEPGHPAGRGNVRAARYRPALPAGCGARPGRASRAGSRARPDRPVPDIPGDAAPAGGSGRPARPGADPR